ncbi:MAG: hypothetical protein JNM61_07130 [Zoogloeaceae bacterium]|nr:hypothetical protein [Zoogloeaceae bacterium]
MAYRFSIAIVRSANRPKAKKEPAERTSPRWHRHVGAQLCALSLLPNNRLMEVIGTLEACETSASEDKPTKTRKASAEKQWIYDLLTNSGLSEDLKMANRRSRKRQALLGDEQGQLSDHLSLRAYPVRAQVPQNKYMARNFVLLVACHLTEGWFLLALRKMQQRWQERKVLSFGVVEPKMLAPREWRAFKIQLSHELRQASDQQSRPVVLHTQKEEEGLWSGDLPEGWKVVGDMPPAALGKERLVIRCEIKANSTMVICQLPSFVKAVAPSQVLEKLPNLKALKHPDKDELIHALWAELQRLRQGSVADSSGADPAPKKRRSSRRRIRVAGSKRRKVGPTAAV